MLRYRIASIFLLIVSGLCIIRGTLFFLAEKDYLLARNGSTVTVLVGSHWLLLGAATVWLIAVSVRRRTSPENIGAPGLFHRVGVWRTVRYIAYIGFGAVLYSTLVCLAGFLGEWSQQLNALTGSIGLTGIAAYLLIASHRSSSTPGSHPLKKPRKPAVLDVVAANILAVLLGAELLLDIQSRIRPSPLFYNPSTVEKNLAIHKKAPGDRWYGFPCNSGGYLDREFITAGPDDLVVASIGDSFGFGVVPYEYNFNTVAEKRLQDALADHFARIAVHNFSAVAIGVNEYAHLLRHEVMMTNPRCIVLNIFIGNDLTGFSKSSTGRMFLQDWWIWKVPRAMMIRQREPMTALKQPEDTPRSFVPDFIHDPSREPPSMSRDAFMALETKRFRLCDPDYPDTRRDFSGFSRALAHLKSLAGDRLIVAVIPDEFQVSDTLYDELLAAYPYPERIRRDYPQEFVKDLCRVLEIEHVDYLEPLRNAPQDGRLYHFRDTHWNARGNRIAGDVLADAVIEKLQREAVNSGN